MAPTSALRSRRKPGTLFFAALFLLLCATLIPSVSAQNELAADSSGSGNGGDDDDDASNATVLPTLPTTVPTTTTTTTTVAPAAIAIRLFFSADLNVTSGAQLKGRAREIVTKYTKIRASEIVSIVAGQRRRRMDQRRRALSATQRLDVLLDPSVSANKAKKASNDIRGNTTMQLQLRRLYELVSVSSNGYATPLP